MDTSAHNQIGMTLTAALIAVLLTALSGWTFFESTAMARIGGGLDNVATNVMAESGSLRLARIK